MSFPCPAPRRAVRFRGVLGAVLALSSLAAALPAWAGPTPVELTSSVLLERTSSKDGKARTDLVEPAVVVPGDALQFVTAYANATGQAVTRFVVTNPVPGAVVLDPASAAALAVSVDAGATWGRLADLKMPDGKGGQRPAEAGDITHVRWTIPRIEAGASGKVSYRAIVR